MTQHVLWSRASVCVSVCLSAAVRPHYCTDPDVTWGRRSSCLLVVHYWADLQSGHRLRCYGNNANTSYKLASIPRYDDIVRTAGWAGSARATGRRPAGDGGRPQNRAPTGHRRGSFSTLLRQSGLRASTGGVLATKANAKC